MADASRFLPQQAFRGEDAMFFSRYGRSHKTALRTLSDSDVATIQTFAQQSWEFQGLICLRWDDTMVITRKRRDRG